MYVAVVPSHAYSFVPPDPTAIDFLGVLEVELGVALEDEDDELPPERLLLMFEAAATLPARFGNDVVGVVGVVDFTLPK